MSTRSTLLVDTSVAVALAVADHDAHATTVRAVGERRLGLSGQAAFETYSVLSRLPAPLRRHPAAIGRLIEVSFPATVHLPDDAAAPLLAEMAAVGIAGGAVYDALVAAAARAHDLPLATRDVRAVPTYRAIGAEIQLVT